jgi:hypothetical protein
MSNTGKKDVVDVARRCVVQIALAMVVWYLLLPPLNPYQLPGQRWDATASLSKWFYYNESNPSDWKTPMDRAHAMKIDSLPQCEAKRQARWPNNGLSMPLPNIGGDARSRSAPFDHRQY